jgi:hypothetical protein
MNYNRHTIKKLERIATVIVVCAIIAFIVSLYVLYNIEILNNI